MFDRYITDYGARLTDALQTKYIQKAIDECFLAGGGTVRIPKGIFRTGVVRLRSNVTLYLENGAILEGSQNPEDYLSYLDDELEPILQEEIDKFKDKKRSADPYSRWSNGIIRAMNAENIAIIGEEFSIIDGMNCFDALGEEQYRGPHPISLHFCKNITLKGYTIRRSANWGHAIFCSQNITIDDVTVLGGHDGFDVRTCDNVLIQNCYFDTGDDCIAGFDNNNVHVRDCLLGSSCFLFRFGGNNVLIENCKSLDGGSYGFPGELTPDEKRRMISTDDTAVHRTGACFMYYCDFRAEIRKPVANILVRNCEFGDLMTIYSQNWNEDYLWCCNRPMEQIKFENCKFNSVYASIYIHASPDDPMLFEMENCDITVKPGYENISFFDGNDFGKLKLKNVTLHGYNDPRIIMHTKGEVEMENCTEMRIIETNDPDFLGPYMDQVLMTENGPETLRDNKK